MDKKFLDLISYESASSFAYKMHYENKFSYAEFNEIKLYIKKIIENKCSLDKNTKKEIIINTIKTFQHILYLFMCDSDIDDCYKIESGDIDKMDVYFEIRDLTDEILIHLI